MKKKIPYTVVHSDDSWLLARLCTDLQMDGIEQNSSWNELRNPFSDYFGLYYGYMAIGENGRQQILFFSHRCGDEAIRYELTERNYLDVLTKIIG